MDFKNLNKNFANRLRDLMFEYKLTYSAIGQNTGYTRQSVTNYLENRAHQNFDFLQKYYSYLNSIDPNHNLNFEYFINPDCEVKSRITNENLLSIGISQNSINNISEIISKNGKYSFDLFNFFDSDKLNLEKVFILNTLLESKNLGKLINAIIDLNTKSSSKNESQLDIDFINWKIENILKDFSNDITKQIINK